MWFVESGAGGWFCILERGTQTLSNNPSKQASPEEHIALQNSETYKTVDPIRYSGTAVDGFDTTLFASASELASNITLLCCFRMQLQNRACCDGLHATGEGAQIYLPPFDASVI